LACWHPSLVRPPGGCARDLCFSRAGDSDSALRARESIMPSGMRRWRFVPRPSRDIWCNSHGTIARGSYDPDRWYANLISFGLTAVQIDSLMRELVSQTLTELTELYSVRYAALQQHHSAPNV
jgi:hypothetical protein